MIVIRRTIQHEFLRLLAEADFSFETGDDEPRGIQRRVMEAVNKQYYGRQKLKTNPQQVSDWVKRVRENNYQVTDVRQNYTKSSQNARRFFEAEQKRIREFVVEEKIKCTEIASVWSDRENKQIAVSRESARRILKRKLGDEPSMVAAKPKGHRIGGKTAHHNKCRYLEAKYWKSQPQRVINGMWFADESKMSLREHKNKQIDIEWVIRGTAGESNWYETPRWPGQINLFILQSRDGIELYDIYDRNMNKSMYKEKLPKIREIINNSDADFTVYMHDNAWKGVQPTAELNRHIGRNKWTQYMGKPCNKDHPTMKTPIRKQPVKVPKLRCSCTFPEGPIHAAFNPKMNIVEETFAKLDRIMTENKIKDANNNKKWIIRGSGKKKFWTKQLKKAIRQLNKDKQFFINQYDTYKDRCDAFIRSRGKRLKTSKW